MLVVVTVAGIDAAETCRGVTTPESFVAARITKNSNVPKTAIPTITISTAR
jgi:hypothetical protein